MNLWLICDVGYLLSVSVFLQNSVFVCLFISYFVVSLRCG